jgi:hypothetical protein
LVSLGQAGLLAGGFWVKSFFGTTTERREKILNHGWARMGREAQGYAWASQAGAVLSNSFTSKLARDCETPSLILLRKWPCDASPWNFRVKKTGLRLACQAGRCFEKASASALASVFYKTDLAFAARMTR